MAEEPRIKRSAKKPAWMNDEMLIDPAEVEAEVKVPRPPARKPHPAHDVTQRMMAAHHEVMMQRPCRPSGRMCSNPQCKNPFDSPQWRRGPLGPGTLCNACGTRYARLQAKMNGDKKGKMRPQERAEWEAFEQQRLHPRVPQHQTWRLQMQHFVEREQFQQQQQQQQHQQQHQFYAHEQDDYAGFEDSDYGYDERSYGSQQQAASNRFQQQYAEEDVADPEVTEDGQLLCQEGLSDSPDIASRTAVAAAAAAAAPPGGAARPGPSSSRAIWRGSRQHIPADAATDSQEDEAGAYSCQEAPAGADTAGGGSPAAPSFLHLLAVGEAMIKTEGVAPQDRRAAWTEVVGRGLGPEPDKAPARPAGGEVLQGVKRSRFALEAEEQQSGRPGPTTEPTALQRALERCGQQPATKRAKPGTGGETVVATDRFERLLAEAEECIRARSVSPCMLKGMPGPGTSPTCNMPAPRPITPLQLGMNAMDAANARAGLPRSLLGVELQAQQDGPQGMAAFMLPAAAVPGRGPPAAAAAGTSSDGRARGRHSSLAQALAAAAAAEANSPEDDAGDAGAGQQDSPGSQVGVGAGSAASLGNQADAVKAFYGATSDGYAGAAAGAGTYLPHYSSQAGREPPGQAQQGPVLDHFQDDVEAMQAQMVPSSEPSPSSKLLMADEVLSPTTMLMPAKARKQARPGQQPHGAAAMGVAAAPGVAAGRRPGSSSHVLAQQIHPAAGAGRVSHEGSRPVQMRQPEVPVQQQLVGQAGLQQPVLLPPVLLQQAEAARHQHQQLDVAQAGQGPLLTAAQLQQAGQRPMVLACQLVLQQQGDPASMQPLFESAPESSAHAMHIQQQALQGPSASAALVGSALQLAQQAGGGSTQNHLDQLKAVTESAVAAAATASAVAAATALLWQQLQQQEQARERRRQDKLLEQQQAVQEPPEHNQHVAGHAVGGGPVAGASVGAVDAAADVAAGDEVAAPPHSPMGAAGPDGAARRDATSASISRSSSSSTSAAGLSAAPADSHSVDKQATGQTVASDQAQGPSQAMPGCNAVSSAAATAAPSMPLSTPVGAATDMAGSKAGAEAAPELNATSLAAAAHTATEPECGPAAQAAEQP